MQLPNKVARTNSHTRTLPYEGWKFVTLYSIQKHLPMAGTITSYKVGASGWHTMRGSERRGGEREMGVFTAPDGRSSVHQPSRGAEIDLPYGAVEVTEGQAGLVAKMGEFVEEVSRADTGLRG